MDSATLIMSTSLAAAATLALAGTRGAVRRSPAGNSHIHRTGTVAIPLTPDLAFPLFTPLGERRWAPGWEPRFHSPADGEAGEGAVFSTTAKGHGETLWIIVDWQPERHRARYARVTPGLIAGTVEVTCAPGPHATTVATVTYDLVGLSPEGDRHLSGWTESWYAAYLKGWEEQISAALRAD